MDIKTYIASGVIEAHITGTSSVEESSILECVMKNNAEVMQAVLEVQQVFEQLATSQAIQPPKHLEEAIRSKIKFGTEESAGAKIIPLNQKASRETSATNFPTWMKAASVAFLFGLGYLGYEVNSKNNQLQEISQNNSELSTQLATAEEMNSTIMNSKKIELKGVENHPDMLADIYWHTSKKVFLEMKNLPAAPAGKQYQLWAIVDGKPVDMGVYSAKASSTLQEMKSVDNAQAFAITLENEGGNPTPTMEQMYVMGTI